MCLGPAPTPEAAGPAKDEPVKVGYKTFDSGSHASDYFHHLSSNLPQEQNLNEVPLLASSPCMVCLAHLWTILYASLGAGSDLSNLSTAMHLLQPRLVQPGPVHYEVIMASSL